MLTRLAELSHTAPDANAFEREMLDLYREAVDCEVAAFIPAHDADVVARGLPDHLVAQLGRRRKHYAAELLPLKAAARAGNGVAVDTEVLGGHREKLAYHRELAAHVGGRHSMMAYVPWRGEIVGAVMLGRTGRAFEPSACRRVAQSLPTLGMARSTFGWRPTPRPLPRPKRSWRSWFRGGDILATARTPHTEIVVRDRAGYREMVARSEGDEFVWTRSSIDAPDESGWPYVDLLHLAATRARHRRRALFIGLGGAVAMRQFATVYPGLRIDVVELDPEVVQLAKQYFALDTIPGLEVVIEDAGAFVARHRAPTWDVVVVDAYDATDLAAPIASRTFYDALHRAMHPGGAVACNVVDALASTGPLRRVQSAMVGSFHDLRIVPVVTPTERYAPHDRRNVVVVAHA